MTAPGRRRSSAGRGSAARLLVLLAVQLAALALIANYAVLEHQPLDPDHGYQQLDLLSLDATVPGLPSVPGRATLVVAAGTGTACAAKVAAASRRRDAPGGLTSNYGLVVLVPVAAGGRARPLPPLPGVVRYADPGGRLARAIALPRAATACHPGYAVLDASGKVRYRSYDPDWQRHGGEESILLRAAG